MTPAQAEMLIELALTVREMAAPEAQRRIDEKLAAMGREAKRLRGIPTDN